MAFFLQEYKTIYNFVAWSLPFIVNIAVDVADILKKAFIEALFLFLESRKFKFFLGTSATMNVLVM